MSKNRLSVRQIERELKDLAITIPYLQKYIAPSAYPIPKAGWTISCFNLHHSIMFMKSAEKLCSSFDGSTKLGTSIQAIVLIDENGDAHCVESFATMDGESIALAHTFGQIFIQIALAGKNENLIQDLLTWAKNQISKISMILSDSCPSANKVKEVLATTIRDLSENDEQEIFIGDCSTCIFVPTARSNW